MEVPSMELLGAEGEEKLSAVEKLVEIKIRELSKVANIYYWI